EAVKESFETSSKSLNILLNSQLSANDKAGFGHNGANKSKWMPKIKTVRMSEPIIEEWESDSEDDEIVVKPKEVIKTVKPSFEKIESANARNETVRQAKNTRKNNKGPRVNPVKSKRVNTARPKAEVNTVKASASWVWKPKHQELDHVSKSNSASRTLTRYDYVDALGRFKSVLAWDFKRH
ncbi:hypothetical protein Tco_1518630, partial [Tanacetum coccineum]